MIHYSCDRCKRVLDPEDDLRYVVKLEAYAALEPLEKEEAEEDRDHLLEIQEILERLDDPDDDPLGEQVYQKKRYDLCAECYRKFAKNPLGRELAAHLGFSQN
jgi:hypothetical protein